MANWLVWLPVLLPVAAGAFAALKHWQPWEVVALVAATVPAGAAGACALAWYLIRSRALDEALQSDEQIARALGAALGDAHPWVDATAVGEVWAAHAALPPDRRRELALAVLGLARSCSEYNQYHLGESVIATVRGFVPRPDAPPPFAANDANSPDALARAFGTVVGLCSAHVQDATARALWNEFAATPTDRRGALVAALSGFVHTADLEELHDLDRRLLDALAAFSPPTPEPASAA